MSNYKEGLSGPDFCYMEGHYWLGGICTRCGEQLRCGACGRFVTIEEMDAHLDSDCPVMEEV